MRDNYDNLLKKFVTDPFGNKDQPFDEYWFWEIIMIKYELSYLILYSFI